MARFESTVRVTIASLLAAGMLPSLPGCGQDCPEGQVEERGECVPVDPGDDTETGEGESWGDCLEDPSRDCDGDGFPGSEDCDDEDPGINPDADEVPYDGVDNDCTGGDEEDVDGDGYPAEEVGGSDCDDNDDDINPGADEIYCNYVDEDCDGDAPRGRTSVTYSHDNEIRDCNVRMAWDSQDDRLKVFFSWAHYYTSTCGGYQLSYLTFDESLDKKADRDITPDEGFYSSSHVENVMLSDGSPWLFAHNNCNDTLTVVYPENSAETSWGYWEVFDSVDSVSGLDTCRYTSSDYPSFAYMQSGTLYTIWEDADNWYYDSTSVGDADELSMACSGRDELSLAWASGDYSSGYSLVTSDFDIDSGSFSSTTTLDSGASAPNGAAGRYGDPWVLYYLGSSSGGAVQGVRREGSSWDSATQLSALEASNSGYMGVRPRAAVMDDDQSYLSWIEDGMGDFYGVSHDWGAGNYDRWNDSGTWSCGDVEVDSEGRIWYLYSSKTQYKVVMDCGD